MIVKKGISKHVSKMWFYILRSNIKKKYFFCLKYHTKVLINALRLKNAID